MHDIPLDSHESTNTYEQAVAMLRYTLHTNKEKEEELNEVSHYLEHLGFDFSANEIWNSIEASRVASKHLENALVFLNDEMDERYNPRG